MATVNKSSKGRAKGSIEIHLTERSGDGPICFARVNLYRVVPVKTQSPQIESAQAEADTVKVEQLGEDESAESVARQLGVQGDMAQWQGGDVYKTGLSDGTGCIRFEGLPAGEYVIEYAHLPPVAPRVAIMSPGEQQVLEMAFDFGVCIETCVFDARGERKRGQPLVGDILALRLVYDYSDKVTAEAHSERVAYDKSEEYPYSVALTQSGAVRVEFEFSIPLTQSAGASIKRATSDGAGFAQQYAVFRVNKEVVIMDTVPGVSGASKPIDVRISRTDSGATDDTSLWVRIKHSTDALSFENYTRFIDSLLGSPTSEAAKANQDRVSRVLAYRTVPFTNGEAYRILKAATEAFVMVNCDVSTADGSTPESITRAQGYLTRRDVPHSGATHDSYLGDEGILPYLAIIRRKMPEVPLVNEDALEGHSGELGYQLVQEKLAFPCLLELIWSYWHEEGMLVQSMNAITRRFQNVRSPNGNDPLANLEIDPLRPLNNIIWGYTQDEQNRLSVVRRNYEYDHHYGLRLEGKAVQNFRPVDTRSKFLEAFHHLLRMCSMFYKQDDDTTVKADAFPVLNALKEVHLILSQGAHNQYGDLPSSARIEMLMQQWMLARPEFRDFLPTRMMVAYPEPWMDRVDAMKKLQGWSDTSVIHFRSLAMFGEQLLLSVRFGAWSDIYEPAQAFNWARFWRPQAQGYIHAYRAATGVDLTGTAVDTIVDATMPSVLLQRRLASQQQRSA